MLESGENRQNGSDDISQKRVKKKTPMYRSTRSRSRWCGFGAQRDWVLAALLMWEMRRRKRSEARAPGRGWSCQCDAARGTDESCRKRQRRIRSRVLRVPAVPEQDPSDFWYIGVYHNIGSSFEICYDFFLGGRGEYRFPANSHGKTGFYLQRIGQCSGGNNLTLTGKR